MHNDALESAIRELKLTSEAQWTQMLGEVMDEQPHLMSFIMNLADDFSEEVHEQLMRATVLLSIAFKKTGIQIELITPAGLDKVLEEKVEAYESLAEEEELNPELLSEVANSPLVFERIRKWFAAELGEYMPLLEESQNNIGLLVDVIISSMEEFAVDPNSKTDTPTDA